MSTWKTQVDEVVRELQSLARGRVTGIVGVSISAPPSLAAEDLRDALLRRLRLDHLDVEIEPRDGPIRVISVEFGRRAGTG